jgi:hypothetical protein
MGAIKLSCWMISGDFITKFAMRFEMFRMGDRVRKIPPPIEGVIGYKIRHEKIRRIGTVVGNVGNDAILILWDGNRYPSKFGERFLELANHPQ